MHSDQSRHLVRGVLAGVGGGLVASWFMNEFMEGPGQKLKKSLQTESEARNEQRKQEVMEKNGALTEDATMKTADAVVATATGGRHLSMEGRKKGGPVVHYAFGALMGGLYGGVAEYSEAATAGFGTAFGVALFTGADMVAVPALNLTQSDSEQTPATLASPLAARLVYGATTEFVRRLLRALL